MKTAIIAAIASIASAILAGCAASTPDDARSMGPERRYSFEVADDYQTVYRRVVDIVRPCYQTTLITASMVVNADLYPDTRRGAITVGMYGIATQIHQVIDIEGTATGTRVHAIYPIGPVQTYGERLRGWATGTSQAC